jgi:hypothetical protein
MTVMQSRASFLMGIAFSDYCVLFSTLVIPFFKARSQLKKTG